MLGRWWAAVTMFRHFDSGDYWRLRYSRGGDSGTGSYGEQATFKALSLNDFVAAHSVENMIELGSGDGNVASLLRVPHYVGLDLSVDAVDMARARFTGDETRQFNVIDSEGFHLKQILPASLAVSMDVILHLVEDQTYESYMRDLFACSTRYVGIFSTVTDQQPRFPWRHVRYRDHRAWVTRCWPHAKLVREDLRPGTTGPSTVSAFWYYDIDPSRQCGASGL